MDNEVYFWHVDKHGNLSKACPGMLKVPKRRHLQYLKENMIDEVRFFYLQINVKGFFKLILSLKVCVWPVVPKLLKVAILLFSQCLKKKVSDGVRFLYINNLESYPQIDAGF